MSAPSLREKVFKGSIWSFLGAGGRQFFGFVVFVILSRLLSPSEFGTVAVALAVVEILSGLVRLGFTENLVCSSELSDEEASTIFWVILLAGCGASALAVLSAPFFSYVFGVNDVPKALYWLALVPVLQAASCVHEAKLQRDFMYKALAVRTLNSTIGSGVISILMALAGCGIYSLIFQRVSSAAIICVSLWSSIRWVPSFVYDSRFFLRHARKGFPLLLSNIIGMAKLRVVDIIIGLTLGTASVGLYRTAGKMNDFIVQLVIEPLVSIALPALSKIQNSNASLSEAYRKLVLFSSFFAMPIFLGFGALAPEVVLLLFGPQWEVSGFLMQLLCLTGLSTMLDSFFRPLAVSTGMQKLVSLTNAVQFVVIVLCVSIFSQFDISTVVLGCVVCVNVLLLYTLYLQQRYLKLELAVYISSLLPSTVVSLFMSGCLYLVKSANFLPDAPLARVLVLFVSGGVLYFFIMRVFCREQLFEVLGTLVSFAQVIRQKSTNR